MRGFHSSCSRLDQKPTRCSPDLAHRYVFQSGRHTAASKLSAEALVIGGGGFYPHIGPKDIQFFGNKHGKAGHDPLANFRIFGYEGH